MPTALNEENLIKTVTTFLKGKIPSLECIYLFGSRVDGDARENSDVDLAFLSYTPLNNLKKWDIQQELAVLLKTDVDLIDLNCASEVMQFQVVNSGKRIFASDEKVGEKYEDKVFCLYVDLCELRGPIVNNIRESGSIYG